MAGGVIGIGRGSRRMRYIVAGMMVISFLALIALVVVRAYRDWASCNESSESSVCKKCGCSRIGTTYRSGNGPAGEYMYKVCLECGYHWLEPPLDAIG